MLRAGRRLLGATMIRVGSRLPELLLRGHPRGAGGHGCPRRSDPQRSEPGTTGQEPKARGVSRAVPSDRVVCARRRPEDGVLFKKGETEAGGSSSDSRPLAAGRGETAGDVPRQVLGDPSPESAAASAFRGLASREFPAEVADGTPAPVAVKLVAGAHHLVERRSFLSHPRDALSLLCLMAGLAGLALAAVLIRLAG